MADDGMLLNFSLGDPVSKPQGQKLKGGSWRDRLTAKKALRHRRGDRPSTTRTPNYEIQGSREMRILPATGANEIDFPNSRPSKRQRTTGDDDFRPAANNDQAATAVRDRKAPGGPGASQGPGSKPREVVSSLFTFNPTAQTAAEKNNEEDDGVVAKPSNAPLVDGLDTFTSLGLSARLAAHLLTKLEFKNPTGIQKSSMQQLLKEDADAFIQAQTGSGKTLAYLLPLVQKIMNLSQQKKPGGSNVIVKRDSGLFAIVLAPTRELCDQIFAELDKLLRCANWIVAGKVHGGENMNHEKDRIRKGLNILVATPGRLADHMDNTEKLDVGNVRWLVLDEGDRLMDLGFEEEIQGIVKKLEQRQKKPGYCFPGLPARRTTFLVSATMKMNVQRLGEISLNDAILIKADDADENESSAAKDEEAFLAPAQLKQSYTIVAAKLRLVTLTALLKRLFMRRGSVMKAIVFVSCADSVDFHFELFTHQLESESKPDKADESDDANDESSPALSGSDKDSDSDSDSDSNSKPSNSKATNKDMDPKTDTTIARATLLSTASNPEITLHKLHGSLPQHTRTATLTAFSKNKNASILLCTDVAARGLDLPNVDYVLEYDPPFSSSDHLHRIGRTARLGRDGRACIFLLPGNEEKYITVLRSTSRDNGKNLTHLPYTEILSRGFLPNAPSTSKSNNNKHNYETAATDLQLATERWTLSSPSILEKARRAYQSHIRAYATHVAAERHIFNIQDLHLGHLAKAFALRDRPGSIKVPGLRQTKEDAKKGFKAVRRNGETEPRAGTATDDPEALEARRKMRAKMNQLARGGAAEFNIA